MGVPRVTHELFKAFLTIKRKAIREACPLIVAAFYVEVILGLSHKEGKTRHPWEISLG